MYAHSFTVSHPTGCPQNTDIPVGFALGSTVPFCSSGRASRMPPHA